MKLPIQPPIPTSVQTTELGSSFTALLEALLKYPDRLVDSLSTRRQPTVILQLLGLALIGMAIYGIVVGSLTGGSQMLIAPAKLALGTLLAVFICLPSLYIFACLGGIDASARAVAGALFAAVCLNALLLIGFAPIAWVFSQSTDSVALMGALHLLFWIIGLLFGLRLLGNLSRSFDSKFRNGHLRIWGLIFTLVCLQMTAALRPIISRSDDFFPHEKKFFLTHWFDSLGDNPR